MEKPPPHRYSSGREASDLPCIGGEEGSPLPIMPIDFSCTGQWPLDWAPEEQPAALALLQVAEWEAVAGSRLCVVSCADAPFFIVVGWGSGASAEKKRTFERRTEQALWFPSLVCACMRTDKRVAVFRLACATTRPCPCSHLRTC